MAKFQNKYKTGSTRLPNWDYGQNGSYFITICTHNHVSHFGNIQNDRMCLSNTGIIADILWCEIQHHARNIRLSEFIVMPNHIHGILLLNDDNGEK
jgi:REP element-mobilizing transposase RayT